MASDRRWGFSAHESNSSSTTNRVKNGCESSCSDDGRRATSTSRHDFTKLRNCTVSLSSCSASPSRAPCKKRRARSLTDRVDMALCFHMSAGSMKSPALPSLCHRSKVRVG
ncbi:hypothetical protein BC936DRAFT_144536 [Jimgerdemannia flammicorona]|uniref:Uncharacterized protein n=1 Tax=Jimgerdemannia flammicorona TaxID=994334 RepID=A0A433DCA1_9FUNG|nr:hypothetical protein BC936DRAFT_144536 [Jimgerdemannia flammicorona]